MLVSERQMLVIDLSEAEAQECLRLSKRIVFDGIVEWESPIIKLWMDEFTSNDDHKLLMASTVLPQRLLLSYIHYKES